MGRGLGEALTELVEEVHRVEVVAGHLGGINGLLAELLHLGTLFIKYRLGILLT